MKIFKKIIYIINTTIGCFCFGFAIPKIFTGDYNVASWLLFAASVLFFIIGYYTDEISK